MFGSRELDSLSQQPPGIGVSPIFKASSETIRFWWFPMVGNSWLYNGMVSHQWLRSKASSVFGTNNQPLDLPIFFLQGLSCARFTVENSSIPLSVSVWKKFHIFARRVVIVLLQQRDWWQNLPNIVGGDEMSHQRRRWCDAAADFTQRKKLTSCSTQFRGRNLTEHLFQIETG